MRADTFSWPANLEPGYSATGAITEAFDAAQKRR